MYLNERFEYLHAVKTPLLWIPSYNVATNHFTVLLGEEVRCNSLAHRKQFIQSITIIICSFAFLKQLTVIARQSHWGNALKLAYEDYNYTQWRKKISKQNIVLNVVAVENTVFITGLSYEWTVWLQRAPSCDQQPHGIFTLFNHVHLALDTSPNWGPCLSPSSFFILSLL